MHLFSFCPILTLTLHVSPLVLIYSSHIFPICHIFQIFLPFFFFPNNFLLPSTQSLSLCEFCIFCPSLFDTAFQNLPILSKTYCNLTFNFEIPYPFHPLPLFQILIILTVHPQYSNLQLFSFFLFSFFTLHYVRILYTAFLFTKFSFYCCS